MKFAIITHAEHKLRNNHIYAYEPYVREMNLWIKYVDEVQIVAPILEDKVTSIESKYQFQSNGAQRHSEQREAISSNEKIAVSQTPRNEEMERHPELVEGGLDKKYSNEMLNQTQQDEMKRHSEQSEAISSNKQIATSHTPRNDWIHLIKISAFDITSLKNGAKSIFKIPKICRQIFKAMQWADHIHLRCPGNIGLLGCIVQIVFPSKPKTIKYAGNWDSKSKQPLSYRFQKWILSNTFLTRNAKVLVYGEWSNQTKNIVPFFTASYSERELDQEEQITTSYSTPRNDEINSHPEPVEGFDDLQEKTISLRQAQTDNTERHSEQSEAISPKEQIASLRTPRNDESERHPEPVEGSKVDVLKIIFVGGLTSGKQPLLPVQVVHKLKEKGFPVKLDIYGEGEERTNIEKYIKENNLHKVVVMHGNADKETIKNAYQQAHFLIFISKSEGWPKVVAEAMFWSCLPITSNVSCIPYMLDNGKRGTIVNSDINEIVSVVEDYIKDKEKYIAQVKNAMGWSRQFTLEKFEVEIGKLLNSPLKRGMNYE